MKTWWRDERNASEEYGFRLYASNPNNPYYRERIESLLSRSLWDDSIAIDWNIPEAPIEGSVRTGLAILSASTENIHEPQHGDYLAVIGSTVIASHVMGVSGHNYSTMVENIATNDGNGNQILSNYSGGALMTVDGMVRHVIRSENRLAYYVRTVIDRDPSEGIYYLRRL